MLKTILWMFAFFPLFPAKIGIISIHNPHKPFYLSLQYAPHIAKKLLEKGHEVQEITFPLQRKKIKKFDLLLSTMPHLIPEGLHKQAIIYVDEPPVIYSYLQNYRYLKNFFKVFHWNHDIKGVDGFDKCFFADFQSLHPECIPFHQRKFACLVNAILPKYYVKPNQLYTARKGVAKFYRDFYPDKLTLHGSRGWDKRVIPIYLGKCKDKGKVLRGHKFCYCYENWDNPFHYISEKIFDCFTHRVVPVYLGSSRITDYIPKETFIDARNFSSMEDLHRFLSSINEKQWQGYISAIEAFDKSKAAKLFRREFYTSQILKAVDAFFQQN